MRRVGKVTNRNVRQLFAPRSIDASSSEVPLRRSRATALLNTTTMQNVAWPTITVNSDRSTPSTCVNVAFSAMPVTMPGSASGRMIRNETVSRPKKR